MGDPAHIDTLMGGWWTMRPGVGAIGEQPLRRQLGQLLADMPFIVTKGYGD
jgi:hypothetical protein